MINVTTFTSSITVKDLELEALSERTKQTGLTFKEKQFILSDYNKEFSSTIGEAKTYNELEKILIDKAPDYIKYIGLKAKAQAGFNLAVKAAGAFPFLPSNFLSVPGQANCMKILKNQKIHFFLKVLLNKFRFFL